MAATFKNARLVLTGTYSTAYTVPASTTAIVIGAEVSNIDTATNYDLYMQWLDSSASSAATRIAHGITVPAKASYAPLAGKLVLETGDVIQAYGSTTSKLELSLSIMELTWAQA